MILSITQRKGGPALEYIRSHEVEKLLEIWPVLESVYKFITGDALKGISRDDYIYSMAIGNKPLDDMPPTGKITDPTCNVATTYTAMMKSDMRVVIKDMSSDALRISYVLDRLKYAFRRLPFLQQKVLSLYYLDKLTWKEIAAKISKEGRYITQFAVQEMKRKALDRMTKNLMLPNEQYADLMNILYQIAK
jgi:hypothetical protein